MFTTLLFICGLVISIFLYTNKRKEKIFSDKKAVIITGCDSGIGLWVAKLALDLGFYVVAGCLDQNGDGPSKLQAQGADILELDVTNYQHFLNLKNIMDTLKKKHIDIWCLINNAGIMIYALAEWQIPSHLTTQVNVNLTGTILACNCVLPYIRKNSGRIINVSSPQGVIPSKYMSVYCSTKSGIDSFSKALRFELKPSGCHVVIIRPCCYPGQTNICRGNSQHLKLMLQNMNETTKSDYEAEIEALSAHFEGNFGTKEPSQIHDKLLEKAFEEALTLKTPNDEYNSYPWQVKLFMYLVSWFPSFLLDKIIENDVHVKLINSAASDS